MIGLGRKTGASNKNKFTCERIVFALRHAETDAPGGPRCHRSRLGRSATRSRNCSPVIFAPHVPGIFTARFTSS